MRLNIIRQTRDEVVGTLKLKKLRNAERLVNDAIKEMEHDEMYRFAGVTWENNVLTFKFSRTRFFFKRVIAKQFSKKKYASCDEGTKKFSKTDSKQWDNWKEVLRIEQEKYWLVIFEEI